MNILLVGFGSIGARHLRWLRRLYPEFQYGVFRRAAGEAIPGAKVFTKWEELESFPPDLTLICSPTHLHAEHLEKAGPYLRKGAGVFFEKPYAHSLVDLGRIEKSVGEMELRPFYGCVLRYHPVILGAKTRTDGSDLGKGKSYSIRCLSYLPDWRPQTDYRQSYSAKRAEGGGVLMDLIHEFDYAELLFGEIRSLKGTLGKFSDLEIDSDDYADLEVEHVATRGRLELSYSHRGPAVRGFDIQFEHGALSGDLIGNTLEIRRNANAAPQRETFDSISMDDLYGAQMKAVVAACSQRKGDAEYFRQSLGLNRRLVEFAAKAAH